MSNYFSLFDLEPRFVLDESDLRTRHQRLQRSLHPDRFVSEGPSARRMASSLAADAAEAFAVLSDDYRRALYLLRLAGDPVDEETETTHDPSFLAEQFDWREQLDDSDPQDLDALDDFSHRLKVARQQQFDQLASCFGVEGKPVEDEQPRLHAHRLRFFDRLLEDVDRRQRRLRVGAN